MLDMMIEAKQNEIYWLNSKRKKNQNTISRVTTLPLGLLHSSCTRSGVDLSRFPDNEAILNKLTDILPYKSIIMIYSKVYTQEQQNIVPHYHWKIKIYNKWLKSLWRKKKRPIIQSSNHPIRRNCHLNKILRFLFALKGLNI